MSWIMSKVTPKYLKFDVDVKTYSTGLSEWINIEQCYKGVNIRDKVVCRFDALQCLTRYFKSETITKYRVALMLILNGLVTNPNSYSSAINELIKEDDVFREAIANMYCSCPDNEIFGIYIMNTVAGALLSVEAYYRNFFRGKPMFVICMSNGYIYFSFDDVNEEPLLPDKVDCEVISYVKNWCGRFTYRQQ